MTFPTFDSIPLKDLAAHLKNSPKSQMNAWIIGLYGSFLVETKQKKVRNYPDEFSELTFPQRLTYSLYPSLTFGTYTTISGLGLLGFRVSKNFNVGLGPSYIYHSTRYNFGTIKGSYYGASAYAQLVILSQYFVWTELESIRVNYYNINGEIVKSEWQNAPMIGAGYRQETGRRSSFNVMILYNLGYQQGISWRGTPWAARIGYTF